MSTREPPDPAQGNRPDGFLVALLCVSVVLLVAGLILALSSQGEPGWAIAGPVVLFAGGTLALASSCLFYRRAVHASSRLDEGRRKGFEYRERLRAVLETAADGILTLDEAGRITSCNAGAARMFGYQQGELLGQPLSLLLPGVLGSLSKEVGTGEQRVLGAPETSTAESVEGHRKGGVRFPASLCISKMRLAGRPVYTVVVRDLTEMQQARQKGLVASQAKSNFLVRMSHEVRTPLGGILGMAELLRDTPLTDEQRSHLDTIQQSAETVLGVFSQVIDMAQLLEGIVELGERGFSLRELLRQTITPLAPLARNKGLRIEVSVTPDLPDRVRGDHMRLSKVVANLVGNAIKFTSRGEVAVRVSRLPSGEVQFEVRDTGIGIPRDKLESIFEPFEQADTSSTRKYGGVGLGLSVAGRLAALMGGRIDVESKPGRGSTFRFRVPLPQETEPMPAGPGAVLVVLGSDEERCTLEGHLTTWGMQAAGVPTGRAALAELLRAGVEGNPYSLVLIAEHLPDLSAREVLRRLCGRLDSPPPAILLGHTEKDLPAPAGFTAVLSRPATPAELSQAVRQALSHDSRRVSEPA
jgi:PAS domain S-box-containing protein